MAIERNEKYLTLADSFTICEVKCKRVRKGRISLILDMVLPKDMNKDTLTSLLVDGTTPITSM